MAGNPIAARAGAIGSRWTLHQRVTALCVVVGVLLTLLAAAAGGVAAANRSRLDELVNKNGPLRIHSERLLAVLVDQETAVRGFAVTGVASDLEPYRRGQDEERQIFAEMRRLLAGQVELEAQLGLAEERVAAWRREVAEPVIDAVQTDGTPAGQALIRADSSQHFTQVRTAVRDLQDALAVYRDEIAGAAKRTGGALVWLMFGAAAVVIVSGMALLMLLRRLVAQPVTELAAQVRRVAEGEYQLQISGGGPPEIARLAEDVDGMRRQIAAELDQVQAIRQQLEAANGQLEAQAAELTRSNRDLEQFAYVASHDLQEPLRKVASFCQLLQRRYAGQLDERADQYIAFAVAGAQRMQRLINDLLAFSRVGRVTAGFTDIDLNQAMTDAVSQLESAVQHTGAEVTWADLPTVRGEEALLTNLLANLFSNSMKFARPGQPPRIRVSARRAGDEWEITVADNGIGIEPAFADKVFVIFQRLHSREAYPGTGIGLAIAKKIIEYHGGRIWVDTDYAEGTAVRFTLPVPQQAATEPGEPVPSEPTPTEPKPTDPSEPVPTEPTPTDPTGPVTTPVANDPALAGKEN